MANLVKNVEQQASSIASNSESTNAGDIGVSTSVGNIGVDSAVQQTGKVREIIRPAKRKSEDDLLSEATDAAGTPSKSIRLKSPSPNILRASSRSRSKLR